MISFSRQLLSPSVLKNLPKDKFVIQVIPSEPPTEGELALYRQLRVFGYSLCACRLRRKNAIPTLLELVDYCKFTPGALDDYDQKELISEHRKKYS
jgi:c-di-GMP-related signal transduction protein